MVVKHDRSRLLKKLKTKIKSLQKKEEQSRARLQVALKKIHKLAHEYKIKLALKKRVMENKIAEVRKMSYIKIIDEIEEMIIAGIKTQGKVLSSTIEKIDKKRFGKVPIGKPKKKAKGKKKRGK